MKSIGQMLIGRNLTVAFANFRFEAFQNWKTEFLSVPAIVLTIFLWLKGAPESKPVDAPHMETGK